MSECSCGVDGEWVACIDGQIYGPCEYEHCGGVCEWRQECSCKCHTREGS